MMGAAREVGRSIGPLKKEKKMGRRRKPAGIKPPCDSLGLEDPNQWDGRFPRGH